MPVSVAVIVVAEISYIVIKPFSLARVRLLFTVIFPTITYVRLFVGLVFIIERLP